MPKYTHNILLAVILDQSLINQIVISVEICLKVSNKSVLQSSLGIKEKLGIYRWDGGGREKRRLPGTGDLFFH